jgi:hypothetical protein
MSSKAAITVLGSPEAIQGRWKEDRYRPEYIDSIGAAVEFRAAPGDRGTEIHVDESSAKVKDDLRRFKALVETGVIPRSDGAPEGERAERKLKQRPAQPLDRAELKKVGA